MGNPFANIQLPKVVYSAESQYNGLIEVLEKGEDRYLVVNKVHQSVSHNSPPAKRRYWGRVVEILQKTEPNLKNILILGLGGGTLSHLIHNAFPNVTITSVDIDPVMIDIALKYFDVGEIPNHYIISADACRVVVEPTIYGLNKSMFQAIIVDIYLGEEFPDLGDSGNFLSALKSLVIPGGLILINRIYTKNHQYDVDNFIELLELYLKDIKTETIAGYTNSDNIIIYGRT